MGKTVIMIGDGENDLLALAKADISIGVWHENVSYGSIPSEMSDIRLNNSLMGLQDLLHCLLE